MQSSESSLAMDGINRSTWSASTTVRWFEGLEGYTDPGERAALDLVAKEMKDAPILDIGVGAGRTVPLLRAISENYRAIDYTPALVDACRGKYPAIDVSLGDARDLSRFADETFGLVVFSFNGIDAVNAVDRKAILSEARRVLRKDGVFLFSTHNREGPGHGEKLSFGVHPTRNLRKLATRFAHAVTHFGEAVRNYKQNSRLNYVGDDYSIMNAAAHEHGLLIYYASLDRQLLELEAAGFQPGTVVFGNLEERPISPSENLTPLWWFHLVARR